MSHNVPTSDLRSPTPESESANEVLVKVQGISKKFCRDLKKSLWYGMKDVAAELFPFGQKKTKTPNLTSDLGPPTSDPGLRPGEFWANKDISFELRRGECLGLIGRNGAGKTTLLKMLNGLIKPDEGTIEMRGRVGALIALGAGFNPILSGRENVYVNGSILGITKKELDEKMEDIIDFAEIREFIDAPVQSYSSGMQVRLGFAVATALNPDVLILDEVLAVGDAAFRNKCYKRVISLRKQAAVIFVSHGMEQVSRICDHILMLNAGKVHYFGNVPEGVNAYEKANEDSVDQSDAFLSVSEPINSFEIHELPNEVCSWQKFTFNCLVDSDCDLPKCTLRIMFYNASGGFAADGNYDLDEAEEIKKGSNYLQISIPVVPLKTGKYQFAFNLIDRHGDLVVWSYKQYSVRVTDSHQSGMSDCQIKMELKKYESHV